MRAVAFAALLIPAYVVGASAQTADYAKAYAMAMRCTVFSSVKKDDVHAKAAFDAAVRLGQLQGFENAKVNVDFDWAISREKERLGADPRYVVQTQADCRALGWAQ